MRYNPNDYPDNRDPNERGGGNFLPVGKHVCQVKDHALEQTSGGFGQLMVEFTDRSGRTRKGWFIYEGRAGFQLARLLSAFGWSDPLDLDRPGDVRKAIYSKNVEVVVADETYNGETKTKIKYVNAIRGSAPTSGGSRTFDKHAARSQPTDDDGPPPYSDDEVPF